MNRLFSFFLLPLLGGACLLTATGCHHVPDAAAQDTGKSDTPSLVRVTAGSPTRKPLELFTVQPARIEAFEATALYPKLASYVKEVLVDIGDSVEQDQPLVKLWAPEMKDDLQQKEALLAQAEAEVKQSQAALKASEAVLVSAQSRVAQAAAGVARADAEAERWRGERDRVNTLATGGSVTRKVADETLSQFRAAEAARQEAAAAVESVHAGITEAQANITKAESDIVAAQARQKVAEANISHTKTMLAYLEIKAPFAGVVTRRNVDTGSYVQAAGGAQPLLVVARKDQVRVFVDIPEAEASLVDLGDPATVTAAALRGKDLQGTVTRTSWALDPTNRSIRTEIDLPNDNGALRPGMYANVKIRLEQRDSALTVPATAIVRQGRETFCCVVREGKVARVPVALGLRSGSDIEVLSGLTGEETIVLVRADGLKDGQEVEVAKPEGP